MKDDSLTSEEKLLRLIRKKDKFSAASAALSVQENQGAILSDSAGATQTDEKKMDVLALFIRVLAVLAGIILIFVLTKYTRSQPPPLPAVSAQLQPAGNISAVPSREDEELPVPALEARPFESYKQTMGGRDVFQAPWEKPAVAVAAPNTSASELAKQLKLVGIMLDKDPKAIVEDLATQQTFFVSPGEKIGNVIVSEILEDKVILIFGQEKVELVP